MDDEPSLTLYVGRFLTKIGYKVTVFNDPLAAQEFIMSSPDAFDLVIVDLAMPKMTGLQLAESVRHLNLRAPIIIVSGYLGNVTQEIMQQFRIADKALKPLSNSMLADLLSEQLGVSRRIKGTS